MNQNGKNYDDVDLSGMLKNSRPSVELEEYKNTLITAKMPAIPKSSYW